MIRFLFRLLRGLWRRVLGKGKNEETYARDAGNRGERISSRTAFPRAGHGKRLTNLYIPMGNGEDTEIDMVIVSVSGIFVIETKNYRGQIYGDERWQNWTVRYSRDQCYPFYNPIRQNATHIWALRGLLPELGEGCFFSVVVFGNECRFRTMVYDSPRTAVTQHRNLRRHFKAVVKAYPGTLTREEVGEIFGRLKPYTKVSERTKRRHIQDVNRKRAQAYEDFEEEEDDEAWD